MTAQLPQNLLKLFAPRPPLPYLQPLGPESSKRRRVVISGVGAFLPECVGHDTDYVPTESIADRKKRLKAERDAKAKEAVGKGLEVWDPNSDPNATSDPYKTLFVSRLSYDTTEKDLKREFGKFGPIKSLRIVTDSNGDNKSRGYAFVEYEREKDMKTAYKEGDGLKINDRRVLVDVERGRTVKGWKPRRLGGGLGGTRLGGNDVNQRWSGRDGGYSGGGPPGGSGGYHGGGYGGSGGYGSRGYGGPPDGGYRSGPPRFDGRSSSGYGGGYGGGHGGDRGAPGRYGGGPPREGGSHSSERRYDDRRSDSRSMDHRDYAKTDPRDYSRSAPRDYIKSESRDYIKPEPLDDHGSSRSHRSSSRGYADHSEDRYRSSRSHRDDRDRAGDDGRYSSSSSRRDRDRRSRSPRRDETADR
ncbi:hypothetical protein HDU86_003890 [Geranomyces michiganensis]|nr:hypothetical protein HDU86_003890 [Geranomyces michiganensis]